MSAHPPCSSQARAPTHRKRAGQVHPLPAGDSSTGRPAFCLSFSPLLNLPCEQNLAFSKGMAEDNHNPPVVTDLGMSMWCDSALPVMRGSPWGTSGKVVFALPKALEKNALFHVGMLL